VSVLRHRKGRFRCSATGACAFLLQKLLAPPIDLVVVENLATTPGGREAFEGSGFFFFQARQAADGGFL